MSSPAFKNFVQSRKARAWVVESKTAQHSEVGGNSFLNTVSWPELPKSQNAHIGKSKVPNAAEKQMFHDKRMPERSNTSIKTPKELSRNNITKIAEMAVNLLPSRSKGISVDNAACVAEENKTQFKHEAFCEGIGQFSTASKQITATNNYNNDLPKSTSSDDRRMQRARKRSALKEEKKKIREAEILRKRIEPKGQSVRVISHKMLEMVLKSDKHSISVSSQQKSDIIGLNFPTLEEATKKTKTKSSREHHLDSAGNNESCTNENLPITSIITSKKHKHKKPLEIDIHNLIKNSSKKSSDKGHKISKECPHLKAKQNAPYIGNQLDSSNPERKRGKRREKPKKKRFTLLKAAILEARAIRKHLRELQEQSENAALLPEIKFSNEELKEPDSIEQLQISKEILSSEELHHNNKTLKCETKENEYLNKNISSASVAEVNAGLIQNVSRSGLSPNGNFSQINSNVQHSKISNTNTPKATTKESDETNNDSNEESKQVKFTTENLPKHSRKFREYCDHMVTTDLNMAVKSLVENLVKFQDRLYQRDPIKAFAKRRYLVGFREVKKHLQLKRLKLIIIAPDLETAKTKGGTDDAVAELKDMSNLQCVPYVFALNRRILGHITLKKVGVSCIGVVSYEGAENSFTVIIEALSTARMQYNNLMNTETVTSPVQEEAEETKNNAEVTDLIAASLLAKLRGKSIEEESHCEDRTCSFLAAIEKVTKYEDCSD